MTKPKTTCAAWDGGAIADGIEDLVGVRVEPKTTKTRCGRRRAMSAIDNRRPTCPECRAALARDRAEAETARDELMKATEGRWDEDPERWTHAVCSADELDFEAPSRPRRPGRERR